MSTNLWHRNCPKCSTLISYTSKDTFDRANRKQSGCKTCRQPRAKVHRTPEELIALAAKMQKYHAEYRKRNLKKLTAGKRANLLRIKQIGIEHYGGKCSCCGENTPEFLTIEHKNGRSETDFYGCKKKITGTRAWAKAYSEGWPDRYTVLCYNCNCTKGALGYCPHERLNPADC